MGQKFSALEATHMWSAFVDVLAHHHFDIAADTPRCACGCKVANRRDFAQHQVAQLVFEGVLPRTYELEWGVVRAGEQEPVTLPFEQVLREINHATSPARSVCRSTYPPGPWLEDLGNLP